MCVQQRSMARNEPLGTELGGGRIIAIPHAVIVRPFRGIERRRERNWIFRGSSRPHMTVRHAELRGSLDAYARATDKNNIVGDRSTEMHCRSAGNQRTVAVAQQGRMRWSGHTTG